MSANEYECRWCPKRFETESERNIHHLLGHSKTWTEANDDVETAL